MKPESQHHDDPMTPQQQALARKLQQLAAEPCEPTGGQDAMRRRLHQRLEESMAGDLASETSPSRETLPKADNEPFRGPYRLWSVRWRLAAMLLLGLLLGLVIAQTVQRMSPVGDRAVPPMISGAPSDALPGPESVETHLAAFREVSDFLDQRAAWLAISPDLQDVGVSDRLLNPTYLVQLRVTATRDGERVNATDIMLVPGEPAHLTIPIDSEYQVVYTLIAGRAPDHSLSFSVRIENRHRPGEAASIGTVAQLRDQGVMPAGEVQLDDATYRLTLGYTRIDLNNHGGSVQ